MSELTLSIPPWRSYGHIQAHCIRYRCRAHSNKDDLVFIPFMGAGSEVASCIMNKRHFIGCEIDENFFEKSIPRIEYLCSNKTMLEKWCSDKEMSLKILTIQS